MMRDRTTEELWRTITATQLLRAGTTWRWRVQGITPYVDNDDLSEARTSL
jgi:hypothetical protein